MSTHKTMVVCGLQSLGADPTKPSYLFSSIFKANRPSDDVVPDYDGIMYDQANASSLRRLMQYGLWARSNWEPFFKFTSTREDVLWPIPIKSAGKYLYEGSWLDECTKYAPAFRKVLGAKPDKILDSLKSQNGNDQYQHMAVVFGVIANTKDKFLLSVLFDALNNARLKGITELGYDAEDPSRELLYNCTLSGLPTYENGDGLLDGHVKDDCWMEPGLVLTRQNEHGWERLSGFDITGGRNLHFWRGENETKELTWSTEMNNSSTGLYVPICFDDIKYHQRMKKVTPLTNLTMILVTKVIVIKIPWYAQSWFKVIVIIVMIIISIVVAIFTAGTAVPGIIAADSAIVGAVGAAVGGAISAVLITTVLNVVLDFVIGIVIEEVLKAALTPLLGKNIASLIAGIAGMVATAWVGGFNFGNVLSDITMVINVATKVADFVMKSAMEDVNKKAQAFNDFMNHMQTEVNDHWISHGMEVLTRDQLNPILRDPVTQFRMSQTDVICKAAVLTGYDIADMQMLKIKDHYKNGTTTDLT